MIRTLVVDDDFRVADINATFVERTPGFEVCGRAHTARAAFEAVVQLSPELVLLDLYLPDEFGLDFLRRIQDIQTPPYVIVITAAKQVAVVQRAMRLGVMYYLVKPFTSDRLREHLLAYKATKERIGNLEQASQQDVDKLYSLLRSTPSAPTTIKGTSEPTLDLILTTLRSSPTPMSAAEIASLVGISRPTAQRYLGHLWATNLVKRHLQYGAAGRPTHLYTIA